MPHGATAGDDAFPFLLFTLSIKKVRNDISIPDCTLFKDNSLNFL